MTELHLIAAAIIAGFNWVDLLILLGVGYAAVRGAQLGAAVQLGSYGGFWIGMFLGALIAPKIASLIPATSFWRTVVLLFVVFGAASLIGGLGRQVGNRFGAKLTRYQLGGVDSGVGSVVAVVATLLVVWLIGSIVANLPLAGFSSQVASSKIVKTLSKVMPPTPAVFSRVESFISSQGFPSVFASLPPSISGPVPLPSAAQVAAVVSKVAGSVVKIEGIGCGQIQEGSGFVVAPGEVVTNAHVVAGTHNISIFDSSGQHPATVVLFNPELDIAILKASGMSEKPLTVDTAVKTRGEMGVVLGYPGGGPLTSSSAGVMDTFEAQGRDIYNQGVTTRLVYEIAAIVRPGNSGGPLVDLKGNAIGVVFSRSTTNPDVGFALAMPAVNQEIVAAQNSTAQVSTGACAA